MRRGILGFALTAVAVLGLTGCVGGDPLPTLPPTPTATPLFASEEEALAAAEDAYEAYQLAVDEALTNADSGGLEDVATGDALAAAVESVKGFQADGRRQVGRASISGVVAVDVNQLEEGADGATGQIYACLDLTNVQIVAADGSASQSSTGILPMIVAIEVHGGRLFVSEEQVWDGDNFCA